MIRNYQARITKVTDETSGREFYKIVFADLSGESMPAEFVGKATISAGIDSPKR